MIRVAVWGKIPIIIVLIGKRRKYVKRYITQRKISRRL